MRCFFSVAAPEARVRDASVRCVAMAPDSLKSVVWSWWDSITPRPTPRLPTRGGHATKVHWFASASASPECDSATELSDPACVVALRNVKSASTVSSVSDLMEVMTLVTGGSRKSSTSQ